MKEKFLRFNSVDGLELCGCLFVPQEKTRKAIVHVHGLSGNFFENRMISFLSDAYRKINIAFASFNTRGYGYVTELLKQNGDFINSGSAYEIFEECIYDIEGIILELQKLGYNEFVLEGHSYGCNKVIYAYSKLKEKYNITDIVLLAPCDIYAEFKKEKPEIDNVISTAEILINEGSGDEIINPTDLPMVFSAKTLVNNYKPGKIGDIFRYREGFYQDDILKSINIPALIVIGKEDECVFTTPFSKVDNFLKTNIKNCQIYYIENANHQYNNGEEELTNIVINYFKQEKSTNK